MLYKKIYIKSEADLPKKRDRYITSEHISFPFVPNDQHSKEAWLNAIDWYLQPVQQETNDDEAPKHPTSWRDFTINDGIFDEQEPKQADIDDLNQYIINLLFSAYSDGKRGVTLDVFDRGLEEQMDHIDDYLKSKKNEQETNEQKIKINQMPDNPCLSCTHWNTYGTGYCETVQLCVGYDAYESRKQSTEQPERVSAEEYAENRWKQSQGEFSVTDFMEGYRFANQHPVTKGDILNILEGYKEMLYEASEPRQNIWGIDPDNFDNIANKIANRLGWPL